MTRRYPVYKNSGVEWLGEVPDGWQITRLGTCFLERREKVSDKDYPPLSVTMGGIVPQIETAAKTDDSDNRRLVRQGDFVINSRSDRKGSSGLAHVDGSVSLISIVLAPRSIIDGPFSEWLLKSRNFQEEFYRWGSGIVADLWSTRYDDMRAITLAVPSLPEQRAIAAFLGRETAKIDALVEEQQRLIELLKEKRQAIISHAVTKGLDPTAPMKPSGVEWLGDVPAGWEVRPIKAVAKLAGRIGYRGYTTADIVDEGEGAITLSPSNIRKGVVSFDQSTYLSWAKYQESPEIHLAAQDVVMVKTGSTFGKVGYISDACIPPATINPQLVIFKDVRCLPEYLFLSLNANHTRSRIEVSNTGGTIPTMTQEAIGNFMLALPSHVEQQMIIEFVREATTKLDTLTADAEIAITLLQERRAALISAAVTGKIDVRGLADEAEAA